jgi:hypothetical protein
MVTARQGLGAAARTSSAHPPAASANQRRAENRAMANGAPRCPSFFGESLTLTGTNGATLLAAAAGPWQQRPSNARLVNSVVESTCTACFDASTTAINSTLLPPGAWAGAGGNNIELADAMLGPLADNGGPTQTRLPLVGSPVIDAGDNALLSAGATTDQRGLLRICGRAVDLGAVEGESLARYRWWDVKCWQLLG